MFWKQRSLIPEVWRVGSFGFHSLNHVRLNSDSVDECEAEASEEGLIRSLVVLIYILLSGVPCFLVSPAVCRCASVVREGINLPEQEGVRLEYSGLFYSSQYFMFRQKNVRVVES